jgi:uncharacterized protein (DUF362 family)
VSRVGLSRTEPSYRGLSAPWGPGKAYPELAAWLAPDAGPPNHVYAAVRAALLALGLDESRFGTSAWNPLGALVPRGRRIVLKPNFIRHWNPTAGASVDSVITHGSVLRAMLDYAALAAGPSGSVAIAEAPQHDCDFEEIRRLVGLDAIARLYEEALGIELEVIDLRREAVVYRDGIIVERRALPGDPRGYRLVDLGARSFFHGSGLDPLRFRGADYDSGPTTEHHLGGRHEYLLSESVLSADLVVNLPKLKTHKKTGVTLALKNFVGINGDKNLLPHHSAGSPAAGGDEFPPGSWLATARGMGVELGRKLLARGIGTRVLRAARRVENAARGEEFIRSGNWHGNRTTWRMCLDLNRALYYSDAAGAHWDAPEPVRSVLTVIDGIVAGEGEGPLAPRDRPLGAILAATDPLALDVAAVRLMGFDEQRLPKLREAMNAPRMRIGDVRSARDVQVVEADANGSCCDVALEALAPANIFEAHPGWRGHVEGAVRTGAPRRGAA